MVSFVLAAVYLGKRVKLRLLQEQSLRAEKRIYSIPALRFYAVVDGIKQLLHSSQRVLGPPTLRLGSQLLLLPFDL